MCLGLRMPRVSGGPLNPRILLTHAMQLDRRSVD